MKQGSESSPPATPPIPDKPALPPRKKTLAKQSPVGTIPASSPQIASSSGLSPRRPSIVQPRNSKSHSESMSPMAQVKQHRQPLIDKLKSLPKAPAPFAAALARIKETLVLFEESKDKSIVILKDEISRIVEPVDLFDDEKRTAICAVADLHQNHPTLDHLNGIIEHLTKIKTDLEVLYPTIASELDPIIKGYEEFRTKLLSSTIHERESNFNSSANVVGECVDFGSLDQETALQLHCCDRYQKKIKTNEHGMHPVAQYDGVFYKPNVSAFEVLDTFDLFIQPGTEYAIFALLQLFAGEHCVAAPTSWIKVSHVQKFTSREKRDGYMEKVIQTGLGITGISLQDLLILIGRMQKFTRQVYRPDAIRAIRALQHREKKLHELLERFPIVVTLISEEREFLGAKHIEKGNIDKLMTLDISKKIVSVFQEILSTLGSDQKSYLLHKDPRGFGTLINDSGKEQDIFNRQNFVVTLLKSNSFTDVFTSIAILPDCIEAVTQFYVDGLISLFPYVKYFKVLFPNGTAEELIDAIPNFITRLDMAHFSATFIGHLMARSSDAKPDNFQVRLIRDQITQAVISFQIIGIDNDRALAYPIIKEKKEGSAEFGNRIAVKCIFFLFKIALQQPVAWSMRERILSQLPVFWALNWAALLYEHSQATQTRIEQNVLLKSDQEEIVGGKDDREIRRVLDIPIKVAASTFPQLYRDIYEIYTVLETNVKASHQDLFKRLQPILFAFYDNYIAENPDIFLAYQKVHEQPFLDEKFKDFDFSQYNKDHDAYVTERTFSVSEAITQFTDQFDWSTLSSPVQNQVLDFCAQHFPKLKLFTKCSSEWLNKKLVESVYQGNSGVVKLLVRARANVAICDDADRTLLHILFSRIDRLSDESVLTTLTNLLESSTLPLNRFDAVGFSPLMTVVNYFSSGKVDLAKKAIELLKNRGIKFDLTDPEKGETALDRVIERDLPDLFIILIKNGAGKRVNVENASQFLMRYLREVEYQSSIQKAHDLLMQNNSEYAYRVTLSALCSATPQSGAMLIHGAECGPVYLLPVCIAQVFNDAGEFHEKHSAQMGRRKVAPVYTVKEGKKLTMHLKENPELPGNELAVGTLRRHLFGHGAPFTEVFKFINPKGYAYPVIFSKSVKGRNFHVVLKDPKQSTEVLRNLDHRSTSEMIVSSILINPDDEKPDNIIVEELRIAGTKKFRLPCVDNDHGFVSPLKKDAMGKTELQVKSIYFCLDNMNEPIHPDVVADFLEFNPEQILREWLTDLVTHQEHYQTLFSTDEKKRLLAQGSKKGLINDIKGTQLKGMVKKVQDHLKNPQTPSVVPIPMRPELVVVLYHKMLAIQKAFKKNPYITGMQLLRYVIPEIGVLYEESFKNHNTPLGRFDTLTGHLYSKVVAGRYGTMINSHQILDSLDLPQEFTHDEKLQAQFGPKQALIMLKLVHSQSKQLDETLTDLYDGNFKRFRELQLPDHKEDVMNKIDWRLLKARDEQQKTNDQAFTPELIQFLCSQKLSLRRAKLAFCPVTKEQLITMLKNSPELTRLDLSYCPVVDDSLVQLIEKYAPKLEVLNIQGTLINGFVSSNLLKLRRLMVQDCLNLINVSVSGHRSTSHPTLTMVAIDRSNKIKKLDVNSDALMILSCEGISPECAEILYEVNKYKNTIVAESLLKYSPQRQLTKLQQLFSAGKFDEAASYGNEMIEKESMPPSEILRSAYKICGISYYNLKLFEKATQVFREGNKIGNDSETMMYYGMSVCELDESIWHARGILNLALNSEQHIQGLDSSRILSDNFSTWKRDLAILGKIYFEIGKCDFIGCEQYDASENFVCAIRCDSNLIEQLTSYIEEIAISDLHRAIDLLRCINGLRADISILYYLRGVLIIRKTEASSDSSQYSNAIEDFNQSIRLDPTQADSYYQRGLCKRKLPGVYTSIQALDDFNATLRRDPKHEGVCSLLGESIKSINKLDRLIDKSPIDGEKYYLRGVAKAKMGRHEEAIQDFDSAFRFGFSSADLYFRRGKCKLKLKDLKPGVFDCYKEAIGDFSLAIHEQCDDPGVYFHLGVAWYLSDVNLIEQDRYKKYFKEAIARDPKYAEKYPIKHVFDRARGNDRSAEVREKSSAKDDSSSRHLVRQGNSDALVPVSVNSSEKVKTDLSTEVADECSQRGKFYLEKGSYLLALNNYDEAIRNVSDNAENYKNRAVINLVLGNIDNAQNDCDHALALFPGYIAALMIKSISNLYSGNFDMSLIDISKSILRLSTFKDHSTLSLALALKAFILLCQNSLDSAHSVIEEANKTLSYTDHKRNLGPTVKARRVIDVTNGLLQCVAGEVKKGESCFSEAIQHLHLKHERCEILIFIAIGLRYIQTKYISVSVAMARKYINEVRRVNAEHKFAQILSSHLNSFDGKEFHLSLDRCMAGDQVEALCELESLEANIKNNILDFLPMRDCINLSSSSTTMWIKNKGVLFLRALKDIRHGKSIDHLVYLADVIECSEVFVNCNVNFYRLARTLVRAEYYLDTLVKKTSEAYWLLVGICGLESHLGLVVEGHIQEYSQWVYREKAALVGIVLGGHLEYLKIIAELWVTVDLDLLNELIGYSLVGGNISIFLYFREKFSDSFDRLFSTNSHETVIEKFFEFALRGGDEGTVEALIAEYSSVYDVSRLNSLALFLGQWKFYKRYQTHGAFDSVVIVESDDLSNADNYERRVVIASSATFTGNLDMLISVKDDVKHVHPKLAIECGCPDIFWYFVSNQFFSLTDTFDNGDTILHILARFGHLTLLREVINKDNFVMVYFVNDKNQSLLHAAAEGGHRNVYDYLLKHFYRNKPIPVDNEGNTPKDLARKVGNEWFLKRLEQNKEVQVIEPTPHKQAHDDSEEELVNESKLIY